MPEAVPLVEALFHDLLATTNNLKKSKEQKNCNCAQKPTEVKIASEELKEKRDAENVQIVGLQKKVADFELLYKESLEVIKNLQCEIEERNKKLLRYELTHKAQIVTQSDKKLKPKLEMTSIVSNDERTSSSGPNYATPTPDSNQINVIGIYTQKNKSLEIQVKNLQEELNTAKKMLANVEKYWSQQAISEKQENTTFLEDPSKSTYALKLMKQNESLKEKLSQLESGAQFCFHGKHLPPGSCQDPVRASIEESHANLQQQQSHIKSTITSSRIKKHPVTSVHGPSYCDKVAQKTHHHLGQQHQQIHGLQDLSLIHI